MPVKEIVTVWSEDGIKKESIKFLRQKTKQVYFPLTSSTKSIIRDLVDTFKHIPCAGIAANQIGYDKSVFIGLKDIDETDDLEEIEKKESDYQESEVTGNDYSDNYEIYINPQIDHTDIKSIQEDVEGCLSFPKISLRIRRFDKIKVRYYDRDGKAVRRSLNGFMSKLFQHELDHLNGLLMVQAEVLEALSEKESYVDSNIYSDLLNEIS